MIRSFLISIVLLLAWLSASAQTQSVSYTHNSAGDRTARTSTTIRGAGDAEKESRTEKTDTSPLSTIIDSSIVQMEYKDSLRRAALAYKRLWNSPNVPLSLTEEEKEMMYEQYLHCLDSMRLCSISNIIRETTDCTSDTLYGVGSIPIQEGISPAGARTYTIPIETAPGFNLVPAVSLSYNSQSGDGWAGYGWNIQGIPTISLINHNQYYHGAPKAASVLELDQKFALDGIPLVSNTNTATSSSYSLETAVGHILVQPIINNYGYICKFEVRYPNGVRAVFGRSNNYHHHMIMYQVSEMENLEGQRLSFEYSGATESGNDRLASIRYGYSGSDRYHAEIVFTYSETEYSTVRYFAGESFQYDFILTSIESLSGGETLNKLVLTHEHDNNVSLLTQIDCFNSQGEYLRPLSFTYGSRPIAERLEKDQNTISINSSYYDTLYTYSYKRGKFVPRDYRDGVIIYPSFPTYYVKGGNAHTGYIYGGNTISNTPFIFVARIQNNTHTDASKMIEGAFQSVDAVDLNGDGTDEIVRINLDGTVGDNTRITIQTFHCNNSKNLEPDDFFGVLLKGKHTTLNGVDSPYHRAFFWGDYIGNGKSQLLAIAYDRNLPGPYGTGQTCYAAMVDPETQRVISDSFLFNLPIDRINCVIVNDIDSDGRVELCYATDNSFRIYHYYISGDTGYFALDKELSGSTTPTASVFTSTDRPAYFTDLNGDGFLDIMVPPEVGTNSTWTRYAYDGTKFVSSEISIFTRESVDNYMFIDVNYDGLSDLVNIRSQALGTFINNDCSSFGDFQLAQGIIPDIRGVVPANAISYNSLSSFIYVDSLTIHNYSYTAIAPEHRQVKTLEDSYGKVFCNSYGYLPSLVASWTDSSYSPSLSDGYAVRPLPLYVLSEDLSFISSPTSYETMLDHKLYSYYDAVVHNKGLGFCGFHRILAEKRNYTGTGLISSTNRVFNPEKRGVLTTVEERVSSTIGTSYYSVSNTWDSHSTPSGKLSPRLDNSVVTDNLTGVTSTTSYIYDSFDFPTREYTVRTKNGYTTQRDLHFWKYQHSNSPLKYVLGVVKADSLMHDRDGETILSWEEKTVNEYDTFLRPVSRKSYAGRRRSAAASFLSTFKDSTKLVSTTHWTYDSFGNVSSETSAPYDATEFVGTTYVYDTLGRFLVSSTDALGRATTYSGYNKFGKPAIVTDHLGRSVTYTYDAWGNLTQTVYADSSVAQTSRAWGGVGSFTVASSATGKPSTIVHYDALGRELRSAQQRFDGQWQWTARQYDSHGRLSKVSLPFRGGTPTSPPSTSSGVYWNSYSYDSYHRPTKIQEASGRQTTWSYNGTSTTTTKDGIASTSTTDVSGNVISVKDPGGTITYNLRDDGQPLSITAPGSVVTSFWYDGYGRRTWMSDPSAGTRSFTYTWNSDGSSNTVNTGQNGTTTTYKDKYGRTTSFTRTGAFSTSYSYDTYGRLSSETSTNGTSTTYTYDSLDRVKSVREDVPDSKWLKKEFEYGPGSNIASILYISQADTLTREIYSYAYGHNTSIILPDSTVVYSLVSENDLGQPTEITTGTVSRTYGFNAYGLPTYRKMAGGTLQDFSYSFTATNGNLSSRSDAGNSTSETFSYDGLNRLTAMSFTAGGSSTYRTVSYDGSVGTSGSTKGNITSMTGVGTMSYSNSAKPYQISSLTAAADTLVPSRSQSIIYTCYDRPSYLTEGARRTTLTYNGAHDRVKMTVEQGPAVMSTVVLTRYYIGGRYELDETPGSGSTTNTKERFYLGGDVYSAPMVLVRENGGSWTAYNIGRDYLGSITHIATKTGTLVAEYSYDPWGRLRNPQTLKVYAAGSEPELFLGRGYTGHEHLTWFGLINMNARFYDPLLGRFLSPDPYVQAPDFTQNFNRYVYAVDNPLKYSDESGENPILFAMAFGAIIGAISGGMVAIQSGVQNVGFYMFGGAIIGLMSGAIGAGAGMAISAATHLGGFLGGSWPGLVSGFSTGFYSAYARNLLYGSNVSDAFSSAMLAGAIGALSGGILGGIGGGINARLNGGNFWTGVGEAFDMVYDPTVFNGNNDPVLYSQESVQAFSDRNVRNLPDWIKLKADGAMPKGYSLDDSGNVLNDKEQIVLGSCVRTKSDSFTAYVYEAACSNKQRLYIVLVHEYSHAYLRTIGIPIEQHHTIITDWQYRQSLQWDYDINKYGSDYLDYHDLKNNAYEDYNYIGLNELFPILNRWHIL